MLRAVPVLAGLLLLLCAARSDAQRTSAAPPPRTGATLLRPVTLITTGNLDFGTLAVTGSGSATINPQTGALTTAGTIAAAGGNPRPATFAGASGNVPLGLVFLPTQPVLIQRSGGSETMQVRNFNMHVVSTTTTPRGLTFVFNVGATLTVPAGQADGLYSGAFDVTIFYP